MICLHGDAADYASGWRGDLPGIGWISFWMRALDDAKSVISDIYLAWLAVQFKEQRPHSIGVRITGRQKFEDERFSRLDFDSDLFAGSQDVVKGGRRENADVRVSLPEL